ncbi:MAG: ABC transporter substrate-binding protein [Polyangiales bacterium]
MVTRRRFIGQSAVASVALSTFGGTGCRKSNEIQVGVILGLSGEDSSLGVETKEGIEIALQEINDGGGFRGRRLKVLYEDTRLNGDLANEKIQRLIDRDRVLCVIGDAASGPTLAARNYAEKAKVPLISGSATNVEVTRGARYVFRVCFTDAVQGSAGAKFAREVLKVDRAAIIYATGNKYSEGLQAIFTREFEQRGGKIVAKETYQLGETNILSFLSSIKSKDPQLIYAPVYPSDLGKIGPTKKQIELAAPLLGTDGWDGPATRAKGVIETLEGCYFTDLFAADGPNTIQAFVTKYKSIYGGKNPSSLAAGGYDALKLAFDAMTRAKELTSEALRDALEQTKGFHSVSGVIDIDEGHNAQKPVPVMKIADGDFKYDSQITL